VQVDWRLVTRTERRILRWIGAALLFFAFVCLLIGQGGIWCVPTIVLGVAAIALPAALRRRPPLDPAAQPRAAFVRALANVLQEGKRVSTLPSVEMVAEAPTWQDVTATFLRGALADPEAARSFTALGAASGDASATTSLVVRLRGQVQFLARLQSRQAQVAMNADWPRPASEVRG
jgi:hypothetical protein